MAKVRDDADSAVGGAPRTVEPPDVEVAEYAAEPLEASQPARSKSSLGALMSESAVYGVGIILGRGLGFFLTPILARSFDAAEFGRLDLLQTAALLCSMLLSLQMESALLRYYHSETDKRSLTSTYLIAQVALGAAFLLAAAVIAVPLGRNYALSASLVMSAAASVVAGLIWTHAITVLRAERAAPLAATMITIDTALNLAAVVILIAQMKVGITGYFAARACSNLASATAVFVMRRDLYRLHFSWPVLIRFLRFGVPLTPEGFVSFTTSQIGKLFLLRYASLADVGLLAVANRVATGIKLVLSSLRQAWTPYAYSVANDQEAGVAIAGALRGYAYIAGFLMLAFVLLSKEAVLVLAGRDYLPARWLLGLVAASALIGGLPYLFNIGLLLGERTSYYTVGVALSSATVVAASWWLIREYGLIGAPLAGVCGSLVLTAAVLYFSQKIRPIPYNMRVLAAFVAGVLATAALGATRWVEGPIAIRLLVLAAAAAWMLRDAPIAALWTKWTKLTTR